MALASSLGSSMVNALYVLDEPSIGLHPRDCGRLVEILKRLRDLPNTIVVVEHDPEIIRQADRILDMGPRAGENGGEIMYDGPASRIAGTLTGDYLTGKRRIPIPQRGKNQNVLEWIRIEGASENNLKDVTVDIPLGVMTCLTGVSGSGKSTLAADILFKAVQRIKGLASERPGTISGHPGPGSHLRSGSGGSACGGTNPQSQCPDLYRRHGSPSKASGQYPAGP